MILSINDFIFENLSDKKVVPFYIKPDVQKALYRIGDDISVELINLIKKNCVVSYIGMGNQKDTFTFITADKLLEDRYLSFDLTPSGLGVDSFYNKLKNYKIEKNISEIKVGRFIRKLFGNKFSDVDIDIFVQKWKAYFSETDLQFKILDNEYIPWAYSSRNYTQLGKFNSSLMSSCMNDVSFIKFYTEQCSKNVKVIVLVNKIDENDFKKNHVFGRALLWELSNGEKFMDRIYNVFPENYIQFENYAKENNFLYQKSSYFIKGEEIRNNLNISVELDKDFDFMKYFLKYVDTGLKDFPYLDTLSYGYGNILCNKRPNIDRYLILNSTMGSAEVF
jgi:hypothetical protein